MKASDTEAIKTYCLTKYYGRSIGLRELSFSVRRGEIYGFLGPNGAGKTTTIRLLLGLIKPSSGEIWIAGNKISEMRKEQRNGIGYLPGEAGFYRDMTGYKYLVHFLKLREAGDAGFHKMERLMNRFGIAFHKKISAYSKGMKQIVGVIQAFMHDPGLVILDEPTSGLDPIMQDRFYELLLEERDKGKTIFFSSHILSEVEKVCDRIGMIKSGKLVREEEIGGYRSNVVKKVSVVPAEPQNALKILRTLSGMKNIAVSNGKVEFFYKGDMQSLIRSAAEIKLRDFVCASPSLEDLFHRYYEE